MNDKTRKEIGKITIDACDRGFSEETIINTIRILYPGNSKESIQFFILKLLEMYRSLCIAVDEAGGLGYSASTLECMTVLELLTTLATNNIRFFYDK